MKWAIISGEYPPQEGGVSDYTYLLANALASAGDEVHVFAPEVSARAPGPSAVRVHQLAGHFTLRAIRQLDAELKQIRPAPILLVQYVPHAFGMKAMNLPFCFWIWCRRRRRIWVMFHEVLFGFCRGQGLRRQLLALVTWVMAALVARSAERVFISIPEWESFLKRVAHGQKRVSWLPVFSNLQCESKPQPTRIRDVVSADRQTILLGHFGSCGGQIRACLEAAVPPLLAADARRRFALVGGDKDKLAERLRSRHPELQGRVISSGNLTASGACDWIAACDLLIQPYPDGVSSRRGSTMAGLALAVPVLTNEGALSEPLWRRSNAVAIADEFTAGAFVRATEELLGSPERLRYLAASGGRLYVENFEMSKVVARLRSCAGAVAAAGSSETQSMQSEAPAQC